MLWFSAVSAAESVTQPKVDTDLLANEIVARLSLVDEFEFIRTEAQKMGIRVWLFGGTAAGFANYVRADLLTRHGKTGFHQDFFDYHYFNIYSSTQDADLVIDGTPEQALQLESLLRLRYDYLQGSRSSWEVRLLKQSHGQKFKLLNNPDYLNQHNDSQSTNLIELTTSTQNPEPRIRDLRDWNNPMPRFLHDTAEGKITYYFSDLHESTSRFNDGTNPPILSAIRCLSKAFQHNLLISPEDHAKILEVVSTFEPNEITHPYVRNWIENQGKKLLLNAFNLETSWKAIDEMGLRQKLIRLNGNPEVPYSLAWWMNKEPLPSFAVGSKEGITASQLRVSLVSHETKDYATYESLTSTRNLRPNLFISRPDIPGERAVYGKGFYIRPGYDGAANDTGFTVRYHMDPRAVEGADFVRHDGYLRILNGSVLTLIPEDINQDAVKYFQLLAGNTSFRESDRGILQRLRLKFERSRQALTQEELKEICSIVRKGLTAPQLNLKLLEEWLKIPSHQDVPFPFDTDSTPGQVVQLILSGNGAAKNIEEALESALLTAKNSSQYIHGIRLAAEALPGIDLPLITAKTRKHFLSLHPSTEELDFFLNNMLGSSDERTTFLIEAANAGAINLDSFIELIVSFKLLPGLPALAMGFQISSQAKNRGPLLVGAAKALIQRGAFEPRHILQLSYWLPAIDDKWTFLKNIFPNIHDKKTFLKLTATCSAQTYFPENVSHLTRLFLQLQPDTQEKIEFILNIFHPSEALKTVLMETHSLKEFVNIAKSVLRKCRADERFNNEVAIMEAAISFRNQSSDYGPLLRLRRSFKEINFTLVWSQATGSPVVRIDGSQKRLGKKPSRFLQRCRNIFRSILPIP